MNIERLELNGYIGLITYCPDLQGSQQKSKCYKLIVTKDGKEYRNVFGFTHNGAKTEFIRWVNKKTKSC